MNLRNRNLVRLLSEPRSPCCGSRSASFRRAGRRSRRTRRGSSGPTASSASTSISTPATDCTEIGKNTTPAMVENIIDLVHPDYLQIDCKGHPGRVELPDQGRPSGARLRGRSAARLARGHGPARRGALHALLRRVGFQGRPGASRLGRGQRRRQAQRPRPRRSSAPTPTSCSSRNCANWPATTAWTASGWTASAGPRCRTTARRRCKAFREATGIQDVPRKPGQPHWYEFLQFHRQAFRNYLRHYIAEVKKTHPAFQICSNWAFTDHMPEPVCARWISCRATIRRKTASTPRGSRPGSWRGRASRGT